LERASTPESTRTRLAAAVRAARERRGWTRERLAHESGLSFAGIAQIESGRRAEIRVSSLVALAEALGVSVDYLVRDEVAAPMLEHRAYVYDSTDHLAQLVQPALASGLAAGHSILVVAPKPVVGAVKKALGSDARRITSAVSADWYTTPWETTARYGAFVRDARTAGADWVDIFGEPVWSGRSRAQAAAWTRYESLLNLVFAPWPASVGCLYDARAVPRRVRADLHCTHPEVVTAEGSIASASFEPPEQFVTR
jgi:transcriptional regulator with XRE-family HTH domain